MNFEKQIDLLEMATINYNGDQLRDYLVENYGVVNAAHLAPKQWEQFEKELKKGLDLKGY